MPAFVVLQHDYPELHWDFMLEDGDILRTWRLAKRPRAGLTTPCESLPAHRRAYLEYEGPVSGNRGAVTRERAGHYEVVEDTDDRLSIRLQWPGGTLQAQITPPTGLGQASFFNSKEPAVT